MEVYVMRKKIIAGLCLGLFGAAVAFGGLKHNSNASMVGGETEIAGLSMMIEDYYYTCAGTDGLTNPEAIVPEGGNTGSVGAVTDMVGAVNIPTDNAGAVTDSAVSVSGEALDTDVAEDISGEAINDPEAQAQAAAEAQAAADALAQAAAADAAEKAAEDAKFANVGVSIANEYVHIRRKPNTESKILGKLYRGNAATILSTEGEWVKIKSGSVEGYIKSEYLAIGDKAAKLADKYGTKLAKVITTTLKVREERNTECTVLTLVPEDEVFEVVKEYKDWVKILVDDSTKGYVSKEYVDISVEFGKAISIEEEEAIQRAREEAAAEAEREAREAEAREAEARRQAAAAEAARQEAARRAAQSKASNSRSNSKSQSSKSNSQSSSQSSQSSKSSSSTISSSSGTGSDAASYAQKFVGNPYSYGGTSLTNGTDCSGFTQSVYSRFGVSLPRTSGSQASSGSKVDINNLKAGDLVFYASNGSINHVAMYIGGGRVVHASNKRTGITTSNINYRTPYCARRVAK